MRSMKTYSDEVQRLLTSALTPFLGVYAFESEIPERAKLPALLWFNIGYQNDTLVSGSNLNDQPSFRVIVVSDDLTELESIVAEIGKLNNTSNADFQKIKVRANRLEPKETGIDTRRYLIDLNLTE